MFHLWLVLLAYFLSFMIVLCCYFSPCTVVACHHVSLLSSPLYSLCNTTPG